MRHLLASLLILVALTGTAPADSPAPKLPGQTLVNGAKLSALRRDAAAAVLEREAQQGAKGSTIVRTEILEGPAVDPGSDLSIASWTETWTVRRGQKKVGYFVNFIGQGKQGITFTISPKGK